MMVTWGIWYTYEDFLIWIIPSTYQSHESKVWACTISFVHTCIYHFTWCLRSCLRVPMLMTQLSTSAFKLDLPIHMCLFVHAVWLHFTYSLDYFLTILDLHVQIPELGVVDFPYCWSEWRRWSVDHLNCPEPSSSSHSRFSRFSFDCSWASTNSCALYIPL